jgi:branched-chain amino acid aminotransferase
MYATANVNGSILPLEHAKVSINDRGFLYGDSVYEVTRTYSGIPFYLEEHFIRLENSARLAMMQNFPERSLLLEQLKKTVSASMPDNGQDVFMRFTVTRGEGPLDLDPGASQGTSYILVVKEVPKWNPRFYSSGVKLGIPTVRRNSPLSLEPNIKCGNYLNNILAVAQAKKFGADDALILSLDNKLTEASNSNICFVQNDTVLSPLHEPNSNTGNLAGITKGIVSKLCQELGLTYLERTIAKEEICTMQESFVTSATREVMPVACILDESGTVQTFPTGGGPITNSLRTKYQEYILHYVDKNSIHKWF